MSKELLVALLITFIFIILFFIIGGIVIKKLNLSFFGFNIINCFIKMEIQDLSSKKCLCPDSVNFNKCVPTGKTYNNNPNECEKCHPIKIPIIISVLQVILVLIFIIMILSWINVATKTVKF
jgi:hypothetical protein